MFTRLTLKKIMKNIDNDIPLPEPSASEGKLHFNDLAVRLRFLLLFAMAMHTFLPHLENECVSVANS